MLQFFLLAGGNEPPAAVTINLFARYSYRRKEWDSPNT